MGFLFNGFPYVGATLVLYTLGHSLIEAVQIKRKESYGGLSFMGEMGSY